ncbi:MAG: hypothetical protein ACYDAG_03350, partial [Chloroflexota bacterium]
MQAESGPREYSKGGTDDFQESAAGAGQSASINFTAPGTYTYTSATDCLNGSSNPSFNRGD